jgi:hypothetical protein
MVIFGLVDLFELTADICSEGIIWGIFRWPVYKGKNKLIKHKYLI